MQNNDSHDEKVEIVDLDTPSSAWQQHLLHLARRHLAKAPTRSKIIALALLCGIVVLLMVLQPSLYFVPHRTIHPTPSATPVPQVSTTFTMSAANGSIYIAGRDGSLTAYRAQDGRVRWQIKSSTESYYIPVASSQSVYTVVGLGKDAMVEARQASNGRLQWRSLPLPSAPLELWVQEGIVYAINDGTIYAFDADTGKALWHFASGQSTSPGGFLSIEKDIVTINTTNSTVYALQARSGRILWHDQFDSQGTWWSDVDHGIFYTASQGEPLQAFSLNTGKLLWQDTQDENTIGSLSEDNGVVYLSIRDGGMTALRGLDGKVLWHNPDAAPLSTVVSIDNNTLYLLATGDDRLVGIRASDGKTLWQHKINGLSQAARVIDPGHDALYLFSPSSTHEGGFNAIQSRNISTGQQLWQFTPSSPITGYPYMVDGIVYLRLANDTLDAVRLSDGKQLWHYSA